MNLIVNCSIGLLVAFDLMLVLDNEVLSGNVNKISTCEETA